MGNPRRRRISPRRLSSPSTNETAAAAARVDCALSLSSSIAARPRRNPIGEHEQPNLGEERRVGFRGQADNGGRRSIWVWRVGKKRNGSFGGRGLGRGSRLAQRGCFMLGPAPTSLTGRRWTCLDAQSSSSRQN